VAHEALIRGWKQLRGWLDEDRQNLRQQRWIEDRAIEWQGSGKAKDFLLSGKQLKEALKFQKQQVDRFSLSELTEQLLKASKQQQKKVWAFVVAVYMAIPITVAIVLGGFAVRWWYLETKWAVLRRCEIEQTQDGKCAGRAEALRTLLDANISLQSINLSKADLSKADLIKVDFSKANLSKANLRLANLSQANLSNNSDLTSANLESANLESANLSHSVIVNAKFGSANLRQADLNYSNLLKADFLNANLSQADLSHSNLNATKLLQVNLIGANLSYAILYSADLRKANLTGANLTGAYLSSVTHGSANFTEANLSDASLMNLTKFDPEEIKKSCNWEHAKMSKELREQIEKASNPEKQPDCRQWNKLP